MPTDVLPGFSYSKSLGRYRDLGTGRFVARADIVSLLEARVASLENRLTALTTAAVEGKLAPAYFAEQMRTELRRSHLQARAVGAGGIDKLTPADYGSVGRKLRDDYARVANLARDIHDVKVSLPQALNRVQGYAGNARLEFFEADAAAKKEAAAGKGMVLLMIRDLGVAEHCADCLGYYEQGWQLDLPLPCVGSICTTHCRCSVRYREAAIDSAGELIGRRS
jgi:hypothetical protein